MCLVFLDLQGNALSTFEVLLSLNAIQREHPFLQTIEVLVHHNNARSHTTRPRIHILTTNVATFGPFCPIKN
uniref:Uncharacterized protein n=1 Tax=Arion vulgaris TaxID=1028688 RepID=A0A0B7B357_9EUPU